MTTAQRHAMVAWPGSYDYIVDLCGHPTYVHSQNRGCGTVLYRVTDEDRAAMRDLCG